MNDIETTQKNTLTIFGGAAVNPDLIQQLEIDFYTIMELCRHARVIIINSRSRINKLYRYMDLSIFNQNGYVAPLLNVIVMRTDRFSIISRFSKKLALSELRQLQLLNHAICHCLKKHGMAAFSIQAIDKTAISKILNLRPGEIPKAIIIAGFPQH